MDHTSSDSIFTNNMDNNTKQARVVLYFLRIKHSIHILFLLSVANLVMDK